MDTTIRVDPEDVLGSVNRLCLGQNAEWFDFTAPQLWDGADLCPEVVDAVRELGPTTLRFPGGCPGDHYHWRDAIGPRTGRRAVLNPFSEERLEPWFGTDELLGLCRQIDATPWLQTNPVAASPEETAAWARHCRDRGFPVPHWELGNEIYLSRPDNHEPGDANNARIWVPVHDYVERSRAQLHAIREVEPDAAVAAIGGYFPDELKHLLAQPDWTEVVLSGLGAEIDSLAVHALYMPTVWDAAWWLDRTPEDVRALMLAAAGAGAAARRTLAANLRMVDELVPGRQLGLVMTEWLPWFGIAEDAPFFSGTMGSALYTSGVLNAMLSEPRVLAAHFMAFVQPAFGACLTMTADGVRPSVHHAVLGLYARYLGTERVRVEVAGPAFDAAAVGSFPGATGIPLVDALATVDPDGGIALFVANRDLDHPVTVHVDPGAHSSGIGVQLVSAGHPLETNGPLPAVAAGGDPDLHPRERPQDDPIVAVTGPPLEGPGPWDLQLPACSVGVVRWQKSPRAGSQP